MEFNKHKLIASRSGIDRTAARLPRCRHLLLSAGLAINLAPLSIVLPYTHARTCTPRSLPSIVPCPPADAPPQDPWIVCCRCRPLARKNLSTSALGYPQPPLSSICKYAIHWLLAPLSPYLPDAGGGGGGRAEGGAEGGGGRRPAEEEAPPLLLLSPLLPSPPSPSPGLPSPSMRRPVITTCRV